MNMLVVSLASFACGFASMAAIAYVGLRAVVASHDEPVNLEGEIATFRDGRVTLLLLHRQGQFVGQMSSQTALALSARLQRVVSDAITSGESTGVAHSAKRSKLRAVDDPRYAVNGTGKTQMVSDGASDGTA